MITIEKVSLSYRTGFLRLRKQILREISFNTEKNSITGYLGVNGSGKTSTIKLIAGINKPDKGKIRLSGLSPLNPKARHSLGYLPENPYFYEYLTPREALNLYGRLHGLDRATCNSRAQELLERTQLSEDADRHVRGFSKGMRQRLGLAQALIHHPDLLLLDEPLTGLDPMGRLLLRDIIVTERDRGRSIFFSSHILSDVEAICDQLVILNEGQIVFCGRLNDLLDSFEKRGVRVRFRCEGDLPEDITQLPWLATPKNYAHGFEGTLANQEEGQKALDALRKNELTITDFRTLGLSLEEYFLEKFGSSVNSPKV